MNRKFYTAVMVVAITMFAEAVATAQTAPLRGAQSSAEIQPARVAYAEFTRLTGRSLPSTTGELRKLAQETADMQWPNRPAATPSIKLFGSKAENAAEPAVVLTVLPRVSANGQVQALVPEWASPARLFLLAEMEAGVVMVVGSERTECGGTLPFSQHVEPTRWFGILVTESGLVSVVQHEAAGSFLLGYRFTNLIPAGDMDFPVEVLSSGSVRPLMRFFNGRMLGGLSVQAEDGLWHTYPRPIEGSGLLTIGGLDASGMVVFDSIWIGAKPTR